MTTPYFIATIWPTAMKKLGKIKKMIESRYKILEVKKVRFSISWRDMITAIYKDDKIKKKNLDKKVIVMKKYPKEVTFIYIEVEDPKYRTKENGRKLSTVMENLKKKVRAVFGSKSKVNKNPIHIVDRFEHSLNFDEFLRSLL